MFVIVLMTNPRMYDWTQLAKYILKYFNWWLVTADQKSI